MVVTPAGLDGAPRSTFAPGDTVRFRARVLNPAAAAADVPIHVIVSGPRTLLDETGLYNASPGGNPFRLAQVVLPTGLPPRVYTLTAELSSDGAVSRRSASLFVGVVPTPTRAAAPNGPAVQIADVATTSTANEPRGAFRPGERARFWLKLVNAAPLTVTAAPLAVPAGPSELPERTFSVVLPPGISSRAYGLRIVAGALPGAYTLTFDATFAGQTVQRSQSFAVEPGGTPTPATATRALLDPARGAAPAELVGRPPAHRSPGE